MARKSFCCKVNKRFILTVSGLIIITGAAGAGISELSSGLAIQSAVDSKQYIDLGNDSPSEFAATKLASSTQSNGNEVDEEYVNGLGSVSMGGKFKDDVILAPKESPVGQQKAESLKKKTKEKPGKDGLFVIKNKLYNAGNREDLEIPKIDGEKLHSLCTSILSHNDYGIGFTHISRLNQKGFFDFVGETCGREDKSKPSNGKFA